MPWQVVRSRLQAAERSAAGRHAAVMAAMQQLASRGTSILQLASLARAVAPDNALDDAHPLQLASKAVEAALDSLLAGSLDPAPLQEPGSLKGIALCLSPPAAAPAPQAEADEGWEGWEEDAVESEAHAGVSGAPGAEQATAMQLQAVRDDVWHRLEAVLLNEHEGGHASKQDVMQLLMSLAPGDAGQSRCAEYLCPAAGQVHL